MCASSKGEPPVWCGVWVWVWVCATYGLQECVALTRAKEPETLNVPGIELYTADVPSLSSARGPEPPAPVLHQRAPPGAPHSAAICNMYIISHHIIIEFTEVVECVQFYI